MCDVLRTRPGAEGQPLDYCHNIIIIRRGPCLVRRSHHNSSQASLISSPHQARFLMCKMLSFLEHPWRIPENMGKWGKKLGSGLALRALERAPLTARWVVTRLKHVAQVGEYPPILCFYLVSPIIHPTGTRGASEAPSGVPPGSVTTGPRRTVALVKNADVTLVLTRQSRYLPTIPRPWLTEP